MADPLQNTGQTDPQHAWAHMLWHAYLTGDHSQLDMKVRVIRQIFRRLPREPRCKVCVEFQSEFV